MLWSLRQGALSFRSLQAECGGVSPSVMNARLKQLQAAQLVLLGEGGYELTEMGRDLMDRLDPLREWSAQWSAILEE